MTPMFVLRNAYYLNFVKTKQALALNTKQIYLCLKACLLTSTTCNQ